MQVCGRFFLKYIQALSYYFTNISQQNTIKNKVILCSHCNTPLKQYAYKCKECGQLYCVVAITYHSESFAYYIDCNTIVWHNIISNKLRKATLNVTFNPYASSICYNNRVYIIGGSTISDVYEANIKRKSVERKESMLSPKYQNGLCLLENTIYSIGGYNDKNILKECEKYDIITNHWKAIPQLNKGRACLGSFVWAQCIYAFCGAISKDAYTNTMERYKINTSKWKYITVKNPPHPQKSIVGVPIEEGVLIIGGYNGVFQYCINIGRIAYC